MRTGMSGGGLATISGSIVSDVNTSVPISSYFSNSTGNSTSNLVKRIQKYSTKVGPSSLLTGESDQKHLSEVLVNSDYFSHKSTQTSIRIRRNDLRPFPQTVKRSSESENPNVVSQKVTITQSNIPLYQLCRSASYEKAIRSWHEQPKRSRDSSIDSQKKSVKDSSGESTYMKIQNIFNTSNSSNDSSPTVPSEMRETNLTPEKDIPECDKIRISNYPSAALVSKLRIPHRLSFSKGK